MHDQFQLSLVKNKSMQKRSQCSIFGLCGHSLAGQNVIICIYFFFMFVSLPYANARNNSQQKAVVSVNFGYIGITLILVFGCFFLFFIAGCIGCFWTGNDPSINLHGGYTETSRVGDQGLEPIVIEKFPIFAYSYVKGQKLGKETLECAVCLIEFEDKDRIRLLPKCDHVFHPKCIDGWLSNHSTCPVCRANLVPESFETSVTISEEPHEVAIAVEAEVFSQTLMQNRPTRYGGRFPRSHSTGHSLVQLGENLDRLILRLPHIMNMRQLSWSENMVAIPELVSLRMDDYLITGRTGGRRGKSTGAETGRLHELRPFCPSLR